jgi:hypothetical protein
MSFDLSRRRLLEHAAQGLLGVSVVNLLHDSSVSAAEDAKAAAAGGKAKHVIFLRMNGAMSHIDTLDPKPGRPEQGQTQPIATKTPGVQIGQYLPQLANLTNQLAIVRSITTPTADHTQATYLLQTSYRELATIRHPAMGAFANKLMGLRKKTLPDYVVVGAENRHPGCGYLETEYTPVPVANPNLGLQNTKPPAYLKPEMFKERMELIDSFSNAFRKKYSQKQVEAYGEFYRQATQLMGSEDLKAFDLAKESDAVRDRYGRSAFGQGCLLARRLVQNDVRWVEVSHGPWDMHNDIFAENALTARCGVLDQAFSALMQDLAAAGLLKTTLVVLATEFGRSPAINERAGRDHHPGVFSGLLAGAGIKAGGVYGKSDERAFRPDEDGVDVTDFNATVAAALGLPTDKEILSKSGRPFKIAADGRPIKKLLA